MYEDDKKKPVEERYIHEIVDKEGPDGCSLIITYHPFLLKRVHFARCLQGDGTYTGTDSEFVEYEMTMMDIRTGRGMNYSYLQNISFKFSQLSPSAASSSPEQLENHSSFSLIVSKSMSNR